MDTPEDRMQLIGNAAVAAILGVAPSTVSRYRSRYPAGSRYPFPTPTMRGRYAMWDRGEVEAWQATRVRMGLGTARPVEETGSPLRAARLKRGLSQPALVAASGGVIPQQYISRVERGHRALTPVEAEALAAALGVPADTLT